MFETELICIKRNGISYCWNSNKNQIEIFTREVIDNKDCPPDVWHELMTVVSEKLKETKGLKD